MSTNYHENVNKIERALTKFYANRQTLCRGWFRRSAPPLQITARELAEVAAAAVGDTRPSALETERGQRADLAIFDEESFFAESAAQIPSLLKNRKTKRSQNGWIR